MTPVSLPMPCPFCRSPWAVHTCPAPRAPEAPDGTSVIETLARATLRNQFDTGHRRANPSATGNRLAPSTRTGWVPRPVVATQDIMFLCCNVDNRGGAEPRPEGAERAMMYTITWDFGLNRWKESWRCTMCGLSVGRSAVPPYPHWHVFDCPSHGRHTVVVDCFLRPFRIVGQACTRDDRGLYKVVIECTEGFDHRIRPLWIPRVRQLQGTSLPFL